jgi:quinol monooxygenase YgiN
MGEPGAVLCHVVMWTLRDPSAAPRFKQLLDSCKNLVPGMLAFDVGLRSGSLEANADVVLVSRFANASALDAYLNHPHHKTVAAQLGPMREHRHVLDYWTSAADAPPGSEVAHGQAVPPEQAP